MSKFYFWLGKLGDHLFAHEAYEQGYSDGVIESYKDAETEIADLRSQIASLENKVAEASARNG